MAMVEASCRINPVSWVRTKHVSNNARVVHSVSQTTTFLPQLQTEKRKGSGFKWIGSIILIGMALSAVAQDVRIAYVGPLSGPYSDIGAQQQRGFSLAVSEFNGTIGKVVSETADDGCDSPTSQELIIRSVIADQAFAVVGGTCLLGALNLDKIQSLSSAFMWLGSDKSPESMRKASSVFQLGPSRAAAAHIAREASELTKKRVEVGESCFRHHRFTASRDAGHEATVCPVFFADDLKWKPFRDKFFSRFSAAPDLHALIAYEATRIALEALLRTRGRPKEVVLGLHDGEFDTAFGKVRLSQPNPFGAVFVAIPRTDISLDSQSAFASMIENKSCDGCNKGSAECPQGGYAKLRFVTKESDCCTKSSECPQGSMLRLR